MTSLTVEPTAHSRDETKDAARPPVVSSLLARVLLAVIAAAFVVTILGGLDVPFGDSYEGRNGGVWGAGSKAIREDGPIASALGARHESGLVYARHPPLIYSVTATAEWIGGTSPAATRAPSVVAALATIGLLYSLLRTVGVRRIGAVAGTAIVSTTAMFTVYGPMPDTPMLGLPIGLGLVITWLRRRRERALSGGVELALATAAALTAWQAVFVAVLLGAIEAVRARPLSAGAQPVRRLRAAGPYVAGTAIGLTLTLLWVVWAAGGPEHLVEALTERSGAEGGVDGPAIISAQLTALVDLLGIAVLGLVGVLISLRSERYRPAGLILLAAVFGYAALTPTAAAVHDYWLYWAIVPAALGWAFLAEITMDAGRDRGDQLAPVAVAAVTLVLMALGWSTPSTAGQSIEAGTPAGHIVDDLELPADQQHLPTVGVINQYASWITLATGADTAALADRAELEAMASDSPDHVVLASTWCGADDNGLCVPVTGGRGSRIDHQYLLLTAETALARATDGGNSS